MPRMSNVGNDETTGLPVFLYGEIRVRKLRERNVNTFSPSFELIEESLRSLKMTRMTRNTTDSLCLDSQPFNVEKKFVCNFSLSSLQRETTTLCIFFFLYFFLFPAVVFFESMAYDMCSLFLYSYDRVRRGEKLLVLNY